MMNKCLPAVVVIVMVFSATLYADTFLKYERVTGPYSTGNETTPATTSEVVAWIGSEKAVYSDEGYRTILTMATNTMTVIDSAEKVYTVIQFDSVRSLIDQVIEENTEDAQSAAAMKAMMEGIMGSVMQGAMTVTGTGQRQKIGKWDCTGYNVTVQLVVGSTTSDMWVTDQIKVDAKAFNIIKNSVMALLPGFDGIKKEIEKIRGIPVKTVSSYQAGNTTITTTETLVECTEKTAPPEIYSIPEGFAKQSLTDDGER